MKIKKILSIFFIVFSFSFLGCQNENLGDEYVKNQDAQYMFMKEDNSRYVVAGDKGYYFVNGLYIYYADYNTMEAVILCNKPDCIHDKETDPNKKYECNGYVGEQAEKLFTIYEDNIYVYQSVNPLEKSDVPEVVRISLDGTKRKTILKFNDKENINSMALHRGKIYCSISQQILNEKQEDEGLRKYRLVSYDISKLFKKATILKENTAYDGSISNINAYGNNIYFTEYGIDKDINNFSMNSIVYNIKEKTFTNIGKDINSDSISNDSIFKDNIIYIPLFRENGELKLDSYLYICDINGKNTKKLFEDKINSVEIYSDSKYIYIDNVRKVREEKNNGNNISRMLTVYNEDGEIVDNIDISEIPISIEINSGDDKNIFIKYSDDEKNYIKYIDKSEIGSKNFKIQTLFEIENKYVNYNITY